MLLLDFRAHGRSPGRRATFGYLERWDVQAAVEFLQGRGMRRIGLLGFSYGGIASMLAAPICPDVGAVVTDGGPARLRSAIIGRGAELGLPKWLVAFLAWLTVAVTSACLGVNLSRYEPVRWVGKIAPRPILFIHGDLDPYLLLSLPRLRGIQWVPGYGKPGPEHWLPVLRRIRESGKLCQVTVSPEGALTILRALGGRGFCFIIDEPPLTPAEGAAFLRTLRINHQDTKTRSYLLIF